jgi:hypothetical protein
MMMKKGLILAGMIAVTGSAFAQSRSSFLEVDSFSDVTVNVMNSGLTYQIVLGANPTFSYQSQTYNITDLFGFWVLSNDDDLVFSHSNQNGWDAHGNNSGTGGIAGWKTNPNNGITPNQSITFSFTTLDVSRVEQIGFHIRIDGTFPGTQGNTGFATVPEPASMLALGAGLAAIAARRRARK